MGDQCYVSSDNPNSNHLRCRWRATDVLDGLASLLRVTGGSNLT